MGIRRHGKKHQSDNHTANCAPFCTHDYLCLPCHTFFWYEIVSFFTNNNKNVNNNQQTTKTRNLKQLFITFNTNKHIITIMKSFNLWYWLIKQTKKVNMPTNQQRWKRAIARNSRGRATKMRKKKDWKKSLARTRKEAEKGTKIKRPSKSNRK